MIKPMQCPESRRTSARRACLLALVILAMTGGCRRFAAEAPRPPDYIKLTSRASSQATKTVSAAQLDAMFSATTPYSATAAIAANRDINDPAERALTAQASARRAALRALGQRILTSADAEGTTLSQVLKNDAPRRAALRALGQRILTSADAEGTTLSQVLKNDAPRRAALGRLLDTGAKVAFQDKGNGVEAIATIAPQAVRDSLTSRTLGPMIYEDRAPSPQEMEGIRRASLEAAMAKIRTDLKARLLDLKLQGEEGAPTLGAWLVKNPAAMTRLDTMLFLLQPDEIRYRPNGTAE
ncbi:MAG: hypothetical protein M1457_09330 [bacterium]|nr:hypothetical protein [bacterium]